MKKVILLVFLITNISLVFSQESKFNISGTIDIYGTTNFTDGSGTPGILIANPKNASGFGLGFANTVFSYKDNKSGIIVDLAFGPRAEDVNLAGAINQLYAYYKLNDRVTVTAGQFNTFLGYEVISPAVNFNYTVSYLFNAGPFSHTGMKLDYALSEDLSFMLAITNAHAISSAEGNFSGKTQIGGQIGYKGQFLNIIYGAISETSTDDNIFIDYTGGFNLSNKLYLGINAAYSNSEDEDIGYKGAALYLENKMSDIFSIGLRPELFQTISNDETSDLFALTLSANNKLSENLKVITEIRYDSSDEGIIEAFPTEKDVTTITIAAVYKF